MLPVLYCTSNIETFYINSIYNIAYKIDSNSLLLTYIKLS